MSSLTKQWRKSYYNQLTRLVFKINHVHAVATPAALSTYKEETCGLTQLINECGLALADNRFSDASEMVEEAEAIHLFALSQCPR